MAEHSQADIELVHSALRPLLMMLGDYRNLNPTLLLRLTHMIELFPTSFNEKMCNSLMVRGMDCYDSVCYCCLWSCHICAIKCLSKFVVAITGKVPWAKYIYMYMYVLSSA